MHSTQFYFYNKKFLVYKTVNLSKQLPTCFQCLQCPQIIIGLFLSVYLDRICCFLNYFHHSLHHQGPQLVHQVPQRVHQVPQFVHQDPPILLGPPLCLAQLIHLHQNHRSSVSNSHQLPSSISQSLCCLEQDT